jgi:hypothetical protein
MAAQVSCIANNTFWEMTILNENDEFDSPALLASPGTAMRGRCHTDSALHHWNACVVFACNADDTSSCTSTVIDGSASSIGESDSVAEHWEAECSSSPEDAVLCWSDEMEDTGSRQPEAHRAPRQASSLVAQLRQKFKSQESTCRPVNRNEAASAPKTTGIFRNVPKSFTRSALLDMLNSEGFSCDYRLVYLPIDFRSGKPQGYAVVDFASESAGERALACFQGFHAWAATSKACEVSWSQMSQGLASYVERYRNSALMHSSVPDEYKPAIFRQGHRVPFPEPTRQVPAPRKGFAAGGQ